MIGQRFRLNKPTVALYLEGGKEVALEVPAGAEIVVTDDVKVAPMDPTLQVTVKWDGKIVKMFAVDIRQRGERISAVGR